MEFLKSPAVAQDLRKQNGLYSELRRLVYLRNGRIHKVALIRRLVAKYQSKEGGVHYKWAPVPSVEVHFERRRGRLAVFTCGLGSLRWKNSGDVSRAGRLRRLTALDTSPEFFHLRLPRPHLNPARLPLCLPHRTSPEGTGAGGHTQSGILMT